MEKFPIEVLVHIFAYLDDESLQICEQVSSKWLEAIEKENLYAKKCQWLYKRNLKSTFAHHKFHSVIKRNPQASKEFYYKLKNLPGKWNVNEHQEPKVYSFYCKTGDVSEEWISKHNYTGVYDMVWLPDKSYLISSCYDTIQVWDMVDYSRIQVFEGHVLDSEVEKATCFYGCGPALVTGTSKGRLQAFDLVTRNKIGASPIDPFHNEMLSDIKGYDKSLLCVDWRGRLYQWEWTHANDQMKFNLKRTFYPPFPSNNDEVIQRYKMRFCERLVDFNDYIGITNCNDMFCIFDIATVKVGTWVKTSRSVLCQQVFERSAYWAGPEGILYHWRQSIDKDVGVNIINSDDISECYQTRFQDSITSVSVREDKILIGDVNAEIHCLDRKPGVPLNQSSFRFLLETGHSYKSYIWAVEMDESRIFSGDSDACLVVHDFWDHDSKNEDNDVPNKKRKTIQN